jgi:hypothetical protein
MRGQCVTSASVAAMPRQGQRGITLFGLLFWAFLVAVVAYLVLRIFPAINEYRTIQHAVETIAKNQPATVVEVRLAFDKQKDLEYSITSITGKDLVVSKENDKVVISYAYDNVIPIYGPVYVLIKFSGRSK